MPKIIQKKNNDLAQVLKAVKKGFEAVDKRFEAVDKRFDGIDKRLDGIDVRLDGIDVRLDGIDVRLDGIDVRLDKLTLEVVVINEKLDDKVDKKEFYEFKDHVVSALDHLTKKHENHESEHVANLGAHLFVQSDINECRKKLKLKINRRTA